VGQCAPHARRPPQARRRCGGGVCASSPSSGAEEGATTTPSVSRRAALGVGAGAVLAAAAGTRDASAVGLSRGPLSERIASRDLKNSVRPRETPVSASRAGRVCARHTHGAVQNPQLTSSGSGS
jgi:hypothetical protein